MPRFLVLLGRTALIGTLGLVALVAAAAPAAAGGSKVVVVDGKKVIFRTPDKVIIVPRAHASFYPTYIPPYPVPRRPALKWVPGHWTRQWMPRPHMTHLWTPGGWAPDGTWIPGHWAPRVVDRGHWTRVWVNGYWSRY